MMFRVNLSRRRLLRFASTLLPASALGLAVVPPSAESANGSSEPISDAFPAHAPEIVRETVTVAHFDLKRLRELVEARPSLANVAWDWGFGDWESALGAASHMGNRAIAEYLISRGARHSLFSSAMLGQLEVVKAFVAAQPGIQRIRGPHGISLLAHARMGGSGASAVLEYLHSLGDADAAAAELAEADTKALVGTYVFGIGASQQVEITADPKMYGTKMYPSPPPLTWTRKGTMGRPLFHLGERVFYPGGAPHVRIRFADDAGSTIMTVTDAETALTARKKV
jgi:hypothetical protein